MANEEHLAELRKGVESWNRWREEHPEAMPDLTKADLRGMHFGMFNLDYIDLQDAEIVGDSDFDEPDENGDGKVQGYNPSSADFTQASLRGANLSGLSFSNLDDSYPDRDLKSVDLRGADLTEANLSWADIREARLGELIVESSNWHLAEVRIEPYRYERREIQTKLKGANLAGACLDNVNLNNLDLNGANLTEASLIETQALGTDFSNAAFTGACIQDWHINSATKLDRVKCDYVYLKLDWSEERKHYLNERRPSSGVFSPGEFTALFQKALETVDLIFADGIDWKAFFQSFQELRSKYGDNNLSIQAIEKKSGGSFVIRLEVAPELDKAAIHSHAEELYEKDLRLLEERVVEYKDEVSFLRQSNTNLERIVGTMSDNQPTHQTIIQNPGHIAALNTGSGTISHVTQNIGQNLSEITKLITTLREAAHTFPAEQREEALGHLDDLQEDLSKPERQEPSRIKRRLKALVAIALTLGTMAAGTVDFANNLTDLAEKLGVPIELSQSQTSQQLPLLEQPNLHVLLSQSPLSRLSLEPASLQSLVRDNE